MHAKGCFDIIAGGRGFPLIPFEIIFRLSDEAMMSFLKMQLLLLLLLLLSHAFEEAT